MLSKAGRVGSALGMPDVVVVGGGIIGAACAHELARRGVSVTLLEAHELAFGASGRNLGYLDTSKDPALAPLARASLARYLELVDDDPPVPFFLDRTPLGTLTVTLEEDGLADLHAWIEAARLVGVSCERIGDPALHELEPELSSEVVEAWLLHEGSRVDPGTLTVCLAHLARRDGVVVRHHTPVRRILERSGRVVGVATDDEVLEADVVVLAAGPWSGALVRPLGIDLPVFGARGWLVHTSPPRALVHHWVQTEARRLLHGETRHAEVPPPIATSASEFAAGEETRDVSPVIQPLPDGSTLIGTSREPALANQPIELDVPRIVTREATRLVPGLADAPVVSTWSGVRPVSPDERPLIGVVREGLVVATGHGSEGVILAGGTAMLLDALLAGEASPFDPTAFDPARFSR
jgi:glycine/D-amino acid oxidase-like deaminating enzyme